MKILTKRSTKLIAVSISSLLLTSLVGAVAANSSFAEVAAGNVKKATLPSDRSLLLAQAEPRESPFICGMVGEEWADEVYFETRNFHLNICSNKSDGSLLYVGENKKTGASIQLPAIRSAKGPFVVENGRTTYIIDGQTLSIYNGNNRRPSSQERIINSKLP